MIKLGLIGQSIQKSSAPSLHTMLGEMHNVPVTYDLHEPEDKSPEAFARTMNRLREEGYKGCNVTFPYKQVAINQATVFNEAVKLVGSTNTLSFSGDRISAANTDYSGFIRGYKGRLGEEAAGKVLLMGAGGVGRAIAFALFDVGATEVMVFDLYEESAKSLAESINKAGFNASFVSKDTFDDVAMTADGLVNCTPVGHYKTPGNPLGLSLFGSQSWAFDAVYTPMDTEFLIAAHNQGMKIVSGFDLFLYQGLDAFKIFTGIDVDTSLVLARFKEKFGINSNLIG